MLGLRRLTCSLVLLRWAVWRWHSMSVRSPAVSASGTGLLCAAEDVQSVNATLPSMRQPHLQRGMYGIKQLVPQGRAADRVCQDALSSDRLEAFPLSGNLVWEHVGGTCKASIISCLQILHSNSVVLQGGWLPEKLGQPPAFAAMSCVLLSSTMMSPATPTTTVLSVSAAAIACQRSIPAAGCWRIADDEDSES